MRKAQVTLAVLGCIFAVLALPWMLEASPAKSRDHLSARNAARASAPKAKTKTLVHQNEAGDVVLDRIEVSGLNVPVPRVLAEPHDYPQPLCDPVDTVVEVRVHDTEMGNPDTLEVVAAEVSQEATPSAVSQGLARIAHRLGSFFRPKSSEARVRPEDVNLDRLLSQGLRIPVEGVDVEKLRDSFLSRRGKHAKHLAIDIGAPRGTPVLATTDGEIMRVTRERRGGKSIYQRDLTGKYLLFYCHLSRFAENLAPGLKVHKGDVIGYVGATGHVIGGPHLHFSITHLPEDSGNFKAGLAINPYLLFLAGVP